MLIRQQIEVWIKRLFTCTKIALVISLSQSSFAAIVPSYQVSNEDATWTHIGGGVYTVPTSAEDYTNEIWERPVKDNEWIDSDGTRTSTKLYFGYGDLKSGAWGVGTSDEKDYFFAKWEVIGDFQHEVGKDKESKPLEAHYYVYTKPTGKNAFAIEVPSGKDLGADFGDVPGKVNIYDDQNGDVAGPGGITTTGENGGDSFGNKQVKGEGRTNTSTFVTEVAVELSDLGLTMSDFTGSIFDYIYLGVAISNPSDPGTGLFANDFYPEAIGSGQEYDTLRMGTTVVPIPAAVWLFGSGLLGLIGFSKRKKAA